MTDTGYNEGFFTSEDGLKLYYRDYPGQEDQQHPPLLCLSGLTRNTHDFHDLAKRLSPGRRVICMDYRGRGKSDRDPDYRHYAPPIYMQDALALMDHLGLRRAVFLGTSLGGLISMAIGAMMPEKVAAIILNDIGPEVSAEGRDRIMEYVGRDRRFASWEDAAAAQKAMFSAAYPDYTDRDWLQMARSTFVRDEDSGDLRLNYDLKLADALREQAESGDTPDLWAMFAMLKDIPILCLRGALSDVLSEETVARMRQLHPGIEIVDIPNRGHVPDLSEPESVRAIDDFLSRH